MATEEKKRYWLKLDKDFLKSSQIKVIKNMPNGKDYVIFYLALMLESVDELFKKVREGKIDNDKIKDFFMIKDS